MFLIYHLFPQDHEAKRSCVFQGRNPFFSIERWEAIKVSYHAATSGGLIHCVSGDIMFLVCYVI